MKTQSNGRKRQSRNMADSPKAKAHRVAVEMRALRVAFNGVGMLDRQAEELAFHLAEIRTEMLQMAGMIEEICRRQKCTTKEFDRLVSVLAVHWGYHFPKIRRLLDRADLEESTEERIDAARTHQHRGFVKKSV